MVAYLLWGDTTGATRGGPLTRAGNGWPRGLPVPLTPFVGREREGAEVARLVSANRLVTLVGAGGVGKTRLAVEVAAAVAAAFGDGTGLTDLSAVTDPASLAATLAADLGVEERAGTDVREPLLRVLHGQHRLLVVDNCEHLRAAFAEFVVALLGSCPAVVVLATSREPLGVPGEVAWRVPSLAFPWPERMPAERDLESFEAAALFLARARAARPGLVVGPGDVAAVTSICFHLDGIPLALELAAARAGALSLQEIADRLTGWLHGTARPHGCGPGPASDAAGFGRVEPPAPVRTRACGVPAAGRWRAPRQYVPCPRWSRERSRVCWRAWSTSRWSRRTTRLPGAGTGCWR